MGHIPNACSNGVDIGQGHGVFTQHCKAIQVGLYADYACFWKHLCKKHSRIAYISTSILLCREEGVVVCITRCITRARARTSMYEGLIGNSTLLQSCEDRTNTCGRMVVGMLHSTGDIRSSSRADMRSSYQFKCVQIVWLVQS